MTSSLMEWISQVLPKARRVASVCLGAFALAWTGVLGRQARCDPLALLSEAGRTASSTSASSRTRSFVKDGRVWSSAGVSAGIDLALAMVEEDFGHTTALGRRPAGWWCS